MPNENVTRFIEGLSQKAGRDNNLWLDPEGGVMGRFYGCHLTSVFQPVIALDKAGVVGHEAFIRSSTSGATELSPWSLFSLAAQDEDLVALDRLCRTVHALNYYRSADGDLFLNVHGRLLAAVADDHGRAFRRVVDSLGIAPRQIVIETPESSEEDLKLLSFVLVNYRLNGFRVAANVSKPAQVETVLAHVRPDFIKVDARNVVNGEAARGLIEQAESQGVNLIFRRVEKVETLVLLRDAGAKLVQGYALGRPAVLGNREEGEAGAATFLRQPSALAA